MSDVMLVVPEDQRVLFYARDRQLFGFLSNFHPAPIVLDGADWPTVEHYYQAQKSWEPEYRQAVRLATTPGKAKRLGTAPTLPLRLSANSWFHRTGQPMRADWFDVRLDVMRQAVRAKFSQNTDLAELLVATRSAELVEDSRMDSFWGMGTGGQGTNWLGRVLMEVRQEIVTHPRAR